MRYSDNDRLHLIVEYGERLLALNDEVDLSVESLNHDYRLQWMVTTPLYNIGEHAYGLSAEFVSEHADVPWQTIAALRHRLVHHYEGTNWTLVALIIKEELAPLVSAARSILDEQDNSNENRTNKMKDSNNE